MNIFYLDKDPEICAKYHCNKHVIKMMTEYAQILSTCHRILDGTKQLISNDKRKKYIWLLEDEYIDEYNNIGNKKCYIQAYINHPVNIWIRESSNHYKYVYELWKYIHREYTFRYKKFSLSFQLLNNFFCKFPNNIESKSFKTPPRCFGEYNELIPDYENRVLEYKTYYLISKKHMLQYKKREIPMWIKGVSNVE